LRFSQQKHSDHSLWDITFYGLASDTTVSGVPNASIRFYNEDGDSMYLQNIIAHTPKPHNISTDCDLTKKLAPL